MKKIIEIENARESQAAFQKAQIHVHLYWGYWNSLEYGNELIDLDDIHAGNDIEKCVNQMREYGIEQFTISATWSGAQETIQEFETYGAKLVGMTTTKGQPNWDGTERTKPAFLMKVM